MKNPWVIIGVLTVVLFGGAIWFSGVSGEKNNEGIVETENVMGNLEAGVVLTEYSDLQCPACAAFHPVLKEVLNQYPDQIRFEYKHFPLPIHPYAQQAAVAAEAAGQQDKFFEFHDLLFENQQTWSAAATPNVFFLQYAEQLELDIPTFRRHINSSVLRDKVKSDLAEGRRLQVASTPTFLLNGEKMTFETYQDFITQIAFAVDPTAAASSTATNNSQSGSGVRFGL